MRYLIRLLDPFGTSLIDTEYDAEDVTLPNDPSPMDVLTPLMEGAEVRRIVLDPHHPAAFSLQIERKS